MGLATDARAHARPAGHPDPHGKRDHGFRGEVTVVVKEFGGDDGGDGDNDDDEDDDGDDDGCEWWS